MDFRDFTQEQIDKALEATNEKLTDNSVRFELTRMHWTKAGKPRIRGVLRMASSRGDGARKSWTGRRATSANWQVHYDFMDALFTENPEGMILTSLARYENITMFHFKCNKVKDKNAGSIATPVNFGDL